MGHRPRDRFLAPALPAAYLLGAIGLAVILRRRRPWPVAGWLLLAGALAWNVPGLLEQPPTRYYRDDAAWAAGYARMRSLVADLNQREHDVVLSYSITLDGGMETVYWHNFPLVYGRELPLDAVRKAAARFRRAVCLGGYGHHRPGTGNFRKRTRDPGQ